MLPSYEYLPGRTGRTPVLLLPGLFAGGWMWTATTRFLLERGIGVLCLRDALAAVDQTAHGIPALRAAVASLLERLRLRRVHLCGNSFGALVALDLAWHHPEYADTVVLSGAPGLSPEVNIGTGMPREVRREHVEGLARSVFHDPSRCPPELIDRTLEVLSDRRHVATVVRALRLARDYPAAEALSQLGRPTFLVWGEQDRITPAAPWEQAAGVSKRCAFRTVPDSGHSPMLERPGAFNAVLLECLSAVATA